MAVDAVWVSVRAEDGSADGPVPWHQLAPAELLCAAPWRSFRWYAGQRHLSGVYWSSTTSGHLAYESRLELARMQFADFDPTVSWIAAQPFLLQTVIKGCLCRHVPDLVLLGDAVPRVVDVKPLARLTDLVVAFTLAWAREAVQRVPRIVTLRLIPCSDQISVFGARARLGLHEESSPKID
ncbi:TnsA-like heteromeric transposase endonuclease subunit [Longispora sp. NPDC051575]|uniref:TnsA-like heteromeric transposase endonuclease subunit n=1 Tax=Longispora sp. NPDC051575 TaxID=3154943 RepID=UPI003443F8A7